MIDQLTVLYFAFSFFLSESANNFVRIFNADQGRKLTMGEITALDVALTVIEELALEYRSVCQSCYWMVVIDLLQVSLAHYFYFPLMSHWIRISTLGSESFLWEKIEKGTRLINSAPHCYSRAGFGPVM